MFKVVVHNIHFDCICAIQHLRTLKCVHTIISSPIIKQNIIRKSTRKFTQSHALLVSTYTNIMLTWVCTQKIPSYPQIGGLYGMRWWWWWWPVPPLCMCTHKYYLINMQFQKAFNFIAFKTTHQGENNFISFFSFFCCLLISLGSYTFVHLFIYFVVETAWRGWWNVSILYSI